ncbi:glycosyltransferase [Bradyrhizobium sp.]|jgi:dolichol-phosphate mannosyltransferase|uniref:glycosyltransferase n=1 Tax=Bradyrhizobium sp. TaxID=376 RepID=UPI003C44C3A8
MTAAGAVFVGLPAYNEEIALPRLLGRFEDFINRSNDDVMIMIYNDGSSDLTAQIAIEWQRRLPIAIIDCPINRGLGAGVRELVTQSLLRSESNVLIIMDCDDTHDPAQIVGMLRCIERGADVVVASRYARGARVHGVPWLRRLMAVGAMVLFKTIHPVRGVSDYTCGYRAYRVSTLRRAAEHFDGKLITENGFACMVELLLKLNAIGARFTEVPLYLRYDQKPTATKMDVGDNTRRLLSLLLRWRWYGFGT